MRTQPLSTRHLHDHGLGRRDIRHAVDAGMLVRLRRGWYATADTHPSVAAATRVGGRLTCLEVLKVHGAWILPEPALHVRVSSGIAVRPHRGVRIHWSPERLTPGLDGIEEALDSAMGCGDLRSLVVAIDSLANHRLIPRARLRALLHATARGRRVLALHDPAAESGIETLVRLALRRHRIRARSQVTIPGVGRVGFLIGDRLVIEADGFEWHGSREAFERDRDRDRELVRRGFVVIRLSYARVMGDLDGAMLAVLDVVRRRDHRWRAVHRTQLSESGYLIDLSSMNPRQAES